METLKTADHHHDGIFVVDTIDAAFLDGAFLEVNLGEHKVLALVFFGGFLLGLDDFERVGRGCRRVP